MDMTHVDKHSSLQDRYRKLVIDSDEKEQEIKRKLFEKEQANDRLLVELDSYRTKNNKQGIQIVHLEHLLSFFIREEQGVHKSVTPSKNLV